MKTESTPFYQGLNSSVLPLRGQRRLKGITDSKPIKLVLSHKDLPLLPVELRRVNHTTSTNIQDCKLDQSANPTIIALMSNPTQIEQITERVERLLLRYEELQRTNALLADEIIVLTQERDSLKSRLGAARARVDALLERLPENATAHTHAGIVSRPGN